MIAPDRDVAHFNCGFVLNRREASLDVLPRFASIDGPNHHFEPVESVVVQQYRPRELLRWNSGVRSARLQSSWQILTCQGVQHATVRRGRHFG